MALGMEKLDNLDPLFRDKVKDVVHDMELKGWHLRIIWGVRTSEENMLLVQQGVASPSSKHLSGRAVDVIDRMVGYSLDKMHPYYRDLESISKHHGLLWGGDFSSRCDPCHIELP